MARFFELERYSVPFANHFEEKACGNSWKYVLVISEIITPPGEQFFARLGGCAFLASMN